MSQEIKDLDELIERLNFLRTTLNDSLVEAYCGMKAASAYGADCRYVLQSGYKMVSSGKIDQLVELCAEISAISEYLEYIKEDFLNGKPAR